MQCIIAITNPGGKIDENGNQHYGAFRSSGDALSTLMDNGYSIRVWSGHKVGIKDTPDGVLYAYVTPSSIRRPNEIP